MKLQVVIEPLLERRGFAARLGAAFILAAEAPTPEQVHQRLAELLRLRMEQGITVRALSVPTGVPQGSESGWLPDDALTRDCLGYVQQYRTQCDEADRRDTQPG